MKEFIYSVNNGIVKCGGEEGWEEYEKLIKKYIQNLWNIICKLFRKVYKVVFKLKI